MKHHDHHLREREHHPRISIGIFFIVLGLALLAATNDLFKLGSFREYFTWETAMIFIGLLLLLNLRFTGGVLMIAGGIWFLNYRINFISQMVFNQYFWPAVIVLLGILFIISSLFKRKNQDY